MNDTPAADTEDARHVRPFAEWLRQQRRGGLHDELSEAMVQLVDACRETGKPGALVLKLKLDPSEQGEFAHFEVIDDVDLKLPKHQRTASIFFADADANLVVHDPRQQQLGLRGIDGTPTTESHREAR